jgi:dihydropyrimidinase
VRDALVVRGGTVVGSGGSQPADVLVEGERIVAVGEVDGAGARELDAQGCLVLPGGVDAHTHVFGAIAADTASALAGGTTTVISFLDAEPGESPADAAKRTLADEVPESAADVAFHGVIWEPSVYRPGQVAELAALGVTSVKLWLAYRDLGIMADDEEAFAVVREAAGEDVLVQAHCENGPLVEALRREHHAAGRTALRHHGEARPPALEAEAVHRFLVMAELAGARAYVVHVSSRRALAEIAAARRRGQRVFAEACPHHLAFADGVYERPEAIRYMMTPPLRPEEDRRALLRALADGTIDAYASDHGHLRLEPDKLAAEGDITRMPFGVPGIGARMAVGFTLGPAAGAMTVERLVQAACEAPARIFDLYPAKGVLAPGADADIVVYDPNGHTSIGVGKTHHMNMDYSAWEGFEIDGHVDVVLSRGTVIKNSSGYVGSAGHGQFVRRGLSQNLI